ncbi:phospholipase [Comamonadaceae bacterium OH2545_COT-014]|nr:phospholipase [Comamonadaceae bacterium OH2545_COT-014]
MSAHRFARLHPVAWSLRPWAWSLCALAGGHVLPASAADAAPPLPAQSVASQVSAANAWQRCTALADGERLACFDQWAAAQQKLVDAVHERVAATQASPAAMPAPGAAASVLRADVAQAIATAQPVAAADSGTPATASTGIVGVGLEQGCKDRQFSALSRHWELESGSACPTFSLRGFRPTGVSLVAGNRINRLPASPNPANTATTAIDYRKHEMRLQLSVRTKLASGLLTPAGSTLRDSLWVAYSQQSYWQVFSPELSRPFRNTNHEPEVIYVYPTTATLPFGWRWRYSGIGLAHQSNGQSDPLSRSWNRAYLMAGFEQGDRFTLQAKVWKRLREDAAKDNNPDLMHYLGHGEVSAAWQVNPRHTLRATLRGRLDDGRGAARLEWLRSLGDGVGNSFSNLHLHTQLFHGYGDSLLDYNFKRTVFSIGLTLLDF